MKRFRLAALAAVLLALSAPMPALSDIGPAVCRTAEQFKEAFIAHTDGLEDDFTISLSDETAALLLDLEQLRAKPLLSDLTNNCGICSYRWGYIGKTVRFSDIVYYPGKRISYCAANGLESSLSEPERRTLEKARSVLRKTRGLDGADQVLGIHDLLCGMIAYRTDDDSWNENDWAVGALLNGQADCDGYADAFFLCCSLAGFGVRYQHGNSLQPVEDDASHMWNAVCIDGWWVFADVTWDDREDYVSHLYYAMGEDTASRFYQWDREAAVVSAARDTDALRGALGLPVYDAGSWEAAYGLFRANAEGARAALTIRLGDAAGTPDAEERLASLAFQTGAKRYSLTGENGLYEMTVNEWYPSLTFCDTVDDLERLVAQRAAAGDRTFTVLFAPGLSEKMFEDDRVLLEYHLCGTRLSSPVSYSYNAESGRVILTDAQYFRPDEPRAVKDCSALSWDDVYAFFRDSLARRSIRCGVILPKGASAEEEAVREKVIRLLHSCGADSFNYKNTGSFFAEYDISYFPCFTVCDTAEEMETFISQRAAAGDRAFSILFAPGLSEKMFADERALLEYHLCASRIMSPMNYAYNDATGRVTFTDAQYYGPDEQRCVKDCSSLSWDDVYVFLRDSLARRCVRLGLILPAGASMEDEAVRERLSNLVWGCGAESFSWSYGKEYAEINSIKYCGEFAVCKSRQEILSYIRSCAEKGIHSFRICLDPSIGPAYFADGLRQLKAILDESLLKPPYSYRCSSASYYIILEDIEFQ